MNGVGELSGRRALVTGASRGIGRAIAVALGGMGAKLIVAGRRAAELEQTCGAVRALGVECEALVGDLRERAWMERFERIAPSLDVLVHNAAAFAPYAPLERVEPARIDEVLDVVVRAPLAITARVAPAMKARGFGRIVSIGTIAAAHGAEGQVAYSTAKSALLGFTKSLAAECARHGVTVNLVEPGLIATERIAEAVEPRFQERLLANVALGRAGAAEEVANAVAFLCSPRAAYITGEVLRVSGGFGVGLYARERGG